MLRATIFQYPLKCLIVRWESVKFNKSGMQSTNSSSCKSYCLTDRMNSQSTRFDVHSFPAAPNFRRVMKARLARSTWDHLCAVVPSGNIREPVRSHCPVNSPAERATAPRMMAGKAMNRQPKEATNESCWAPLDVRADSTRWKYACKETWYRNTDQYLRNPTVVVQFSLFLVFVLCNQPHKGRKCGTFWRFTWTQKHCKWISRGPYKDQGWF